MLRLHVVHLLHESIGHFACLENRVSQSDVPRICDGLMINHILNGQLFEESALALLLGGSLQVSLLKLGLL